MTAEVEYVELRVVGMMMIACYILIFPVRRRSKMKEYIDNIGRLLTDCSVNFIESENDEEGFGALLMLGELQKRIFP